MIAKRLESCRADIESKRGRIRVRHVVPRLLGTKRGYEHGEFVLTMENDLLDSNVLENGSLPDVSVTDLGPVIGKGTNGLVIRIDETIAIGILTRPNVVEKVLGKEIPRHDVPAGSVVVVAVVGFVIIVAVVVRKGTGVVCKNVNRIKELIVYKQFWMMMQNTTQEVGTSSFPRENDKALVGIRLYKVSQEALATILGVRRNKLETRRRKTAVK